MAERAQHGIGERAFIPRAIVTPAVDEECGCVTHATGTRTLLICLDAQACAARGFFGFVLRLTGKAQL